MTQRQMPSSRRSERPTKSCPTRSFAPHTTMPARTEWTSRSLIPARCTRCYSALRNSSSISESSRYILLQYQPWTLSSSLVLEPALAPALDTSPHHQYQPWAPSLVGWWLASYPTHTRINIDTCAFTPTYMCRILIVRSPRVPRRWPPPPRSK